MTKSVSHSNCLSSLSSDYCFQRVTCRYCGTGAGVVSVVIPYVLRYLASELAAMNIKPVRQQRNRIFTQRCSPCPCQCQTESIVNDIL